MSTCLANSYQAVTIFPVVRPKMEDHAGAPASRDPPPVGRRSFVSAEGNASKAEEPRLDVNDHVISAVLRCRTRALTRGHTIQGAVDNWWRDHDLCDRYPVHLLFRARAIPIRALEAKYIKSFIRVQRKDWRGISISCVGLNSREVPAAVEGQYSLNVPQVRALCGSDQGESMDTRPIPG